MYSNIITSIHGRTIMFPCAAGVQVPQIGAENSKVKITLGKKASSNILPMTIMSQDKTPVNQRYVSMVSTGLSFAEDVIEDRCLHMMPYSDKYFTGVFQAGELVPSAPKVSKEIGRCDRRGTDSRHMPCYLKKIGKSSPLTPLRKEVKEKAILLHKKALISQQEIRPTQNEDESRATSSSSFFLTEIDHDESVKVQKLETIRENAKLEMSVTDLPSSHQLKERVEVEGSTVQEITKQPVGVSKRSIVNDCVISADGSKAKKGDWDDHLMSRLSKLTANWIVHERMPETKQKDKLSGVLESWYGCPTHTDLVREHVSDGEEENKAAEQKPKKKWRKKEALFERVYNKTPPTLEALDPYSDDNKAPFYRQPAGIRRKKKNDDREEAGMTIESESKAAGEVSQEPRAINATAHHVCVSGYQEIPPPTLKDFLSPRVGDKIYETDNLYQQEWLIGTKQVYKIGGDPSEITMESSNKFKKQLQREMPQKPQTWNTIKGNRKDKGSVTALPERGHKRWTGLPEPVDDSAGTVDAFATGFPPVLTKGVDPKQRRKVENNHALITVVHDWRSKWFLSGQFADSTPEDLIQDMADIQPHVRLKAVDTVAKALEYKRPPDHTILLDTKDCDTVNNLPEEMFTALEFLLDDPHKQVRKAASKTLYSMNRPNEKAKVQLRQMLECENSVDRWEAAQCLALFGEGDSDVVDEIIKQILASEVAIKHERGTHLLAKISNSSTLVHCMVAEQLNSSSWRHRVIACKILPTLFGSINKDITHKLSELMWHDWHVEVRKASAQCLGKTSHGRDVHDDIRDKILNGTERTKMEAITKLGQLGIMTAKLLPAFLMCFTENYVSIRCEVCITCGNLMIKEDQMLERLVHLATFDPIWKVKALAIQALGKIGAVNEDIKKCLLWAMRYEERAGVRAEASHSIVLLNIMDDDVIEAIQDRLLVESNQLVREEMIEALSLCGFSISEDMDMVAQIKSEVRKLCTRNIVASQIIFNETDEVKRAQFKRMVCQTEQDIETLNEKKAVILQKIRSSTKSSDSLSSTPQPRTSTPMSKQKRVESESTSPDPVSREGTEFTPTLDRELEAILNQEIEESVNGSTKSRPVTTVSESTAGDEENGFYINGDTKIPSKITVTKHANDVDHGNTEETWQITDGPEKTERYTEKPGSQQQLIIPMASHRSSQQDMASPNVSRLSVAQYSDRRSIMSRESMKERAKLNIEVNAIYNEFDSRYADMIHDLIKIDKGLNLKSSSAESSIISTPCFGTRTDLEKLREIEKENVEIDSNLLEQIQRENANKEAANSRQEASTGGTVNQIDEITNEGPTQNVDHCTKGGDGNCEEKVYPVSEWKSFVDTMSHGSDASCNFSTAYPACDENNGNNEPLYDVNTTGLTGQALEYQNDTNQSRGEDFSGEANIEML